MILLLIFPAVFLFFAFLDMRNNYRRVKHSHVCPCPFGPDACDRGNRS